MNRMLYRMTRLIGPVLVAFACLLALDSFLRASQAAAMLPVETQSPRSAPLPLINFDDLGQVSDWVVSPGPAVSASLDLDTGYLGNGASLSLTLPAYGDYVELSVVLTQPVYASGISFWVKSDSELSLSFGARPVLDGRWSYKLHRPLTARNPEQWYQYVVKLDQPQQVDQLYFYISQESELKSTTTQLWLDEFYAIQDPLLYAAGTGALPVSPLPHVAASLSAITGVSSPWEDWIGSPGLDLVQGLDASMVRIGMGWMMVEVAPGVFDYSYTDPLVNAHEQLWLRTIMQLTGGHTYHTGEWNIPPTTPQQIQAFGNFVEAVATRYKGRRLIYEIFAEPTSGQLNPPLTAVQFAAVLKEASARIRKVDPSATIISGGLVSFSTSYLRETIQAGGLADVDAFGVHSYNIGDPDYLWDRLSRLRFELDRSGYAHLPIWDPEWGISSYPFVWETFSEARQRQARQVARQYLNGWATGLQSVVTWCYQEVTSDPQDWNSYCGLVDANYQVKPAYQALQTLAQVTQGRVQTGLLAGLPANYHGLRVEGGADVALLFWTDEYLSPLTVTVPLQTTVLDFMGAPAPVSVVGETLVFTLSERSGPVYALCSLCQPTLNWNYLPFASK